MNDINLNLYKLKYGELASFAQTIHNGFIEHVSDYPEPNPDMAGFQSRINKLRKAIARWGTRSNYGSDADHRRLLKAAEAVREDLRMLGFYAQNTRPKDTTSWNKLGFTAKQYSRTSRPLPMVQNLHRFIARNIPATVIKLKWEKPLEVKARDVKAYLVVRNNTSEFPSENGVLSFLLATVTKTSFIDEHPLPGENWYWVIPVNSLGPGVVSSPIMVYNPYKKD